MSRKTFLQAVALILIGALAYWIVIQINTWQAERRYEHRMQEVRAEQAAREALLQNEVRASRGY